MREGEESISDGKRDNHKEPYVEHKVYKRMRSVVLRYMYTVHVQRWLLVSYMYMRIHVHCTLVV